MNKLTKVGLSALCGSLASMSSANAGELNVTGTAQATYTSIGHSVTGNPIGMTSAVSFIGEGELDNGWNVKMTIGGNDAGAYSATYIIITLPGMGDVRIDQGASGTGIARYDDNTPSVYEEADGAGISAGIDKVLGVNTGTTIEVTPTDAMPAGLTAHFAYSKDADGGNVSDKTAGGVTGALGSGWDITLEATSDVTGIDGLTIWGGISEVSQRTDQSCISGDAEEMTVGIKYATGGFTLGYQISEEDTGRTGSGAVTKYDNDAYGITFAVNDDLSIGYNHYESDGAGNAADMEASSLQLSYSMGGATINIAEASMDNAKYQTAAANDRDATTIAVSLAF